MTELEKAQRRIRELEAGLEAARKWLLEYVRPDVDAPHFDYGLGIKRNLDPSYLNDLASIRCALRKNGA